MSSSTVFKGHTKFVSFVQCSLDGLQLITSELVCLRCLLSCWAGSWDGSVCVWDPISAVLLRQLYRHQGPIRATRLSTDGTFCSRCRWGLSASS